MRIGRCAPSPQKATRDRPLSCLLRRGPKDPASWPINPRQKQIPGESFDVSHMRFRSRNECESVLCSSLENRCALGGAYFLLNTLQVPTPCRRQTGSSPRGVVSSDSEKRRANHGQVRVDECEPEQSSAAAQPQRLCGPESVSFATGCAVWLRSSYAIAVTATYRCLLR